MGNMGIGEPEKYYQQIFSVKGGGGGVPQNSAKLFLGISVRGVTPNSAKKRDFGRKPHL